MSPIHHNDIVALMIPPFAKFGLLPPGIHWAEWDEFAKTFDATAHRQQLLVGLKAAIDNLAVAGCQAVFIDGSFVTRKTEPNDFDACWSSTGVDPGKLDPVLLDFSDGRKAQKAKFGGELLVAEAPADLEGKTFLDYFQEEIRRGVVR
ncbi:MAG: DUF6932 family protein, partial [Blastocatellia bacterium]